MSVSLYHDIICVTSWKQDFSKVSNVWECWMPFGRAAFGLTQASFASFWIWNSVFFSNSRMDRAFLCMYLCVCAQLCRCNRVRFSDSHPSSVILFVCELLMMAMTGKTCLKWTSVPEHHARFHSCGFVFISPLKTQLLIVNETCRSLSDVRVRCASLLAFAEQRQSRPWRVTRQRSSQF